jgi:hypothetical protein
MVKTRIGSARNRDTDKMENVWIHKRNGWNNSVSKMTLDLIVRTERENSPEGRSVGKQRKRWGGNALVVWKRKKTKLSAKHYQDDYIIKEDKIGEACNTHGHNATDVRTIFGRKPLRKEAIWKIGRRSEDNIVSIMGGLWLVLSDLGQGGLLCTR